MDPIPYAKPPPPKSRPVRSALGVVGVALGAASVLFVTVSLYFAIVAGDNWRAEGPAGVACILATLGAVTSPWNLPRLTAVTGLALSGGTLLALYLISRG